MLSLGVCVRSLSANDRELYLTFDDGPDPIGTSATLDVLARYGVQATFFVVARSAAQHPELVRRAFAEGHAIGNHSLDHTWGAYFGPSTRLRNWIVDAEARISDLTGQPTVGFRSPAGVRTPPLGAVLAELGIPLVHWSHRFYDALWPWRERAALASLRRTPPGSIVLLHDRQRPTCLATYLQTLSRYVETAQAGGYRLRALDRAAVMQAAASPSASANRSPDTRSAPRAASAPSS
jgi:chitooligosaccharide deacetylase